MSDLELLEKRIRHSGVQNWIMAAFGLVFALLALAGAVSCIGAGKTSQGCFIGLAVLVFLFSAWVMAQNARRLLPARSSAVYLALTRDATPLIWTHLTTGKTTAIKLYFVDGEMFTLHGNKKETETLLAFVRSRAPHVLLGYGTDQQTAWWARVKAHRASKA